MYGNRYNGKNKWCMLGEYMRRLIIRGCTDEELVKRLARQYASKLFGNENGIIYNRELIQRIKDYTSSFIYMIKEEVRYGGEPYDKIDLNVVRVRLIKNRTGGRL